MKQFVVLFLTLSMAASLFAAEEQLINVIKRGWAFMAMILLHFSPKARAVKAKADYPVVHNGTIYRFASAQNKMLFENAPKMYKPAFGGYCAFGVSKNVLISIDPEALQIVDGRLFLQYSKEARKDFSKDIKGNTAKADANCPALVERKGTTQ